MAGPWERYQAALPQDDPTPEGPWSRYRAAPQEERPGMLGFLNQGVAQGLGLPVDMATALLNTGVSGVNALAGTDFQGIQEPFGGADSIARGMGAIGADVAPTDVQPEGLVENIMAGTGGAAGALLPFGMVGTAMQGAGGLAGQAGGRLMEAFTRSPALGVASELTAGAGAGAGMELGRKADPESGVSPLVGAIVGGLAGGMSPYAATRTPGLAWAGRQAASQLAPFTETGAMERARRRIDAVTSDPDAAIQGLNAETISDLSPAARTGSRGLMALERRVRDTDQVADDAMRAQEGRSAEELIESIMGIAATADRAAPRAFSESVVGREIDNLNPHLDAYLGEPAGVARTERSVREGSRPARSASYERAYDTPIDYSTEAGWQLEELLGRVERAAPGTINMANRMMAGEGAQSAQIMADIAEDGTVTYFRMPDTRQVDYITRALNQMARSGEGQGALGGQTDMGTIMGGLSRDIRNALRQANPNYGEALETAATPIGQRNALTFGQRLLSPNTPRDVAEMELQGMTGGEMQFVRQGVRSYLDETLSNVRASINTPDVGVAQAQRALRDLSAPAVREKIGMILPEDEAAAFFRRIDETADLIDPRRSGPAVIAGSRPNEEIRALLNSPDPRAATAQFMAQATDDTGREAVAGLKGAFLDELMGRARSRATSDMDASIPSGQAIRDMLQDPRARGVAEELLTPQERNLLTRVADELSTLEQLRSGRLPNVGDVMEGEPNTLVQLAVRIAAAKAGGRAGQGVAGAPLVLAGYVSRRARKALENLTLDRAEVMIRDALTGNSELLETLLTKPTDLSGQNIGALERALSGRAAQSATRSAVGATGAMGVDVPDPDQQ